MADVIKHPSSRARNGEVYERFDRLRKHHDVAVNQMWIGALVCNFTEDEIAMLGSVGFLCENDQRLLDCARRGGPKPRTGQANRDAN